MKHLPSLAVYGLMGSLCLSELGCSPPTPTYLKGTIKSELFDPVPYTDKYTFALQTEHGIKLVTSRGRSATKMDILLDPSDQVTFKIPNNQTERQNDFLVALENIVEINGQLFSP